MASRGSVETVGVQPQRFTNPSGSGLHSLRERAVLEHVKSDITGMLQAWKAGDDAAFDKLVPLVYSELRPIARRWLRRRGNYTLQPTELIHEAFLRLNGPSAVDWQHRAHFFAVASQVMRFILVDYARAKMAAKRGAGALVAIGISEPAGAATDLQPDILDVDHSLEELARLNERQAKIVELRFFGGLSNDEIAETLRISPATVKRDWMVAKTWIHKKLTTQRG
jgi:RNA polymerase sigma factor (TIGR02999 family)